jgi:hypothetical protein
MAGHFSHDFYCLSPLYIILSILHLITSGQRHQLLSEEVSVRTFPVVSWFLVPSLMLLTGCADKSVYNLQTPAASQIEQYVDATNVSKLPNKRLDSVVTR